MIETILKNQTKHHWKLNFSLLRIVESLFDAEKPKQTGSNSNICSFWLLQMILALNSLINPLLHKYKYTQT